MRLIASLFLASGLFAAPALADDECCAGCTPEIAELCTLEMANSCLNMCPVSAEAATLGRQIVIAMPVATVDRGELEA